MRIISKVYEGQCANEVFGHTCMEFPTVPMKYCSYDNLQCK